MSKVVYGVFGQTDAAEALAQHINRDGGHRYALAHVGGVREEEIQFPGTLARRMAIASGLAVGVAAGLIIWGVMWPQNGLTLGFDALVYMVMVGSLFGLVAGAVAGASECKPELAVLADRVETDGGTIVTAEVSNLEVEEVMSEFFEAGGADIHAA